MVFMKAVNQGAVSRKNGARVLLLVSVAKEQRILYRNDKLNNF
jgi:hypothetical protein